MITLISPAKTLDIKPIFRTNKFSLPLFLNDSEQLIFELRKIDPKAIASLMKVNKNIANLTIERILSWKLPFNMDNAKQALLTFKGQVYVGLNAESLSEDDLLFAQDHLRILSGLYGILKPLDLMQPYRLEMGTPLNNSRGKNLYEFWNLKISDSINNELAKQKHKVIINLASNEYFKAIKPKQIKKNIITPVFKETKGEKLKVITVYAKTARGLMTRFIIQNKIENPEDIKAFDTDGYLYNPNLSTTNEWVFVR